MAEELNLSKVIEELNSRVNENRDMIDLTMEEVSSMDKRLSDVENYRDQVLNNLTDPSSGTLKRLDEVELKVENLETKLEDVSSKKENVGELTKSVEDIKADVAPKPQKESLIKKGAKGLGKKVYMQVFNESDILSSYMRSLVDEKNKKESSSHLSFIAKESAVLPDMAKDVNVMRQNLRQLVEIWGPGSKGGIKKESAEERKADVSYFEQQDKKEAELEASRGKTTPTPAGGGDKAVAKEAEGGSLLDTIMRMFASGFTKAISMLLNPKVLFKLFSKIFLPVAIIGSLFSGIMDGFKRYQETGSFSEAIIAGLGGMLKFLTFGIFGEDTVRNLIASVSDFLSPVIDTIGNIFTGIKNFFVKLFGGQVSVPDTAKSEPAKVTPSEPATGQGGSFGGAGASGSWDDKSQKSAAETAGQKAQEKTGGATPAETTPAPAAAAATTPTPAAPAPTKQTSSPDVVKKSQESMQAQADADALQAAEGELQSLHRNWNNEKTAMMENLINKRVEFSDDPASPDYPKELKQIDAKYEKLIGDRKKEIDKLKKKPGVKEEIKKRGIDDKRFEDTGDSSRFEDNRKDFESSSPSKVAGMKYTTTEKVETTGGGETTTARKLTPEAKKAEEELKALDKKQADERREAVAKAKAEGKITGRFAKSTDFEEVGELKALKTKQEAEREALIKKINEGTSIETTKSGGATPTGGGASAAAPSISPPTGGGSESGGKPASGAGGASPSGGAVSPVSGSGASTAAPAAAAKPAAGAGSSGGSSGSGASESGGSASGGTSPALAPQSEQAPVTSVPSGSDLSKESSRIAEEQRMESSNNQGTTVNAPVNNNSTETPDKQPKKTSSVYDSDLASRLSMT